MEKYFGLYADGVDYSKERGGYMGDEIRVGDDVTVAGRIITIDEKLGVERVLVETKNHGIFWVDKKDIKTIRPKMDDIFDKALNGLKDFAKSKLS